MPTRSNIRYWLFRKQNELMGGAKAAGAPTGLFTRFEQQPAFILAGGYKTFAETWDIDRVDPLAIVPRDQSIADEWNDHLVQTAMTLPAASPSPKPSPTRGEGLIAAAPSQHIPSPLVGEGGAVLLEDRDG